VNIRFKVIALIAAIFLILGLAEVLVERRVVLPSSALLMNNDRTSVFVATAPWTFERRAVEALLEESSTVTIAAGVEPGEQVVVRGGILLND